MLTLAKFFVHECIEHVLFCPCHVVHQEVGRIVGQQMDNLDRLVLWLAMGSASDLALILSRPWLVLEEEGSDERGCRDEGGDTHEEYHDVSNREVETCRSDTREDEHPGWVLVVVEVLDGFVPLIKGHLPIYS